MPNYLINKKILVILKVKQRRFALSRPGPHLVYGSINGLTIGQVMSGVSPLTVTHKNYKKGLVMKAFSRAKNRLGSACFMSVSHAVLCGSFASVMSGQEARAWLSI
ncbi:hypothetical protein [Pseudomonas helleri]|uniref:Uncharacterized protein n=1 Tax=Pseudomonas helleri TaxID=1608996 RepID=A0A6L5HNE5_9PSED|nr:hypothetical protein [Pseudomonas helleri]MQU04783.1 hypothetical protein [Pseudomonas helleri]